MTKLEEQWLPIDNYENYYEVSNLGRVRSLPRLTNGRNNSKRLVQGRTLSPGIRKKTGHLYVNLKVNNSTVTRSVHTLVLETFIGPCPPGLECCHNDGNPQNNRVSNLRWDTRVNNIQDMLDHGTHSQASKNRCAQGHHYDDANTIFTKEGRRCRECHRLESSKRFYAKTDVQHGTHRNSRKTHCKHNHEFTEENTYIRPDGRGRMCKKCSRKTIKA
jgi:hypothetical protein